MLLTVGAFVAVAMLLIGGDIRNTLREQHLTGEKISAAFENAFRLGQTLRLLVDAETGQRGYLLTNDPNYLQPYTTAHRELPRQLAALRSAGLAPGGGALQTLAKAKVAELDLTVRLARSGRHDKAMRVVVTGVGKRYLDRARVIIADGIEQQRRKVTTEIQSSALLSTRTYLLLSGLAACAIALVVVTMLLTFRNVRLEAETNRLRAVENAERQTSLLVRELNHRVKNLFSVVLGIVRLSGRFASTPAEAIGSVQSRVEALARAHEASLGLELLQSTDLRALLRATLSPFDCGEASLELVGPPLAVCATCVTPLGMIMHELATNAVKYGAWSTPAGRIVLRWRINDLAVSSAPVSDVHDLQDLHLAWEETCEVPLHVAVRGDGFGAHLIRMSMLQLKGRFNRELRPQGMYITIDAPIVPGYPSRTFAAPDHVRPSRLIAVGYYA